MSAESESDRLLEAQSKVKQVEDITRENLAKVANRGENLDDLQRRTDVLSQSASEFSYTARRIQQKYCWQNVKLWIVILFILIIILVVLISKFHSHCKTPVTSTSPDNRKCSLL